MPSGITRTSSSTATDTDPRLLLTISCFWPTTVTCATVGLSVPGRIIMLPTCITNALEVAVEKTAVPRVKLAAGEISSFAKIATVLPESRRRAAPARTCTLPVPVVNSLSPPNTVVPADKWPPPTLAPSAAMTVPNAGPVAPQPGVMPIATTKIAATTGRQGCILPTPAGQGQEYPVGCKQSISNIHQNISFTACNLMAGKD